MPEKGKNSQEGPDVRGNLIKANVGDDIIFADSNQYKPQVEHAKRLEQQHRKPKNPKSQGQTPGEYSKHGIANYKLFNFADGGDIRCSLHVSGCLFDCPGCYNLAARSFNYGCPYTQELEDKIIEDMFQPYVQGLILLGREPFLNTWACLELINRVHEEFGHTKDVQSWLGYTWDGLQRETPDEKEMLSGIDILVDGRFMDDLKDFTLQFRGLSNQRIIDVQKLLKAKGVVIWDKLAR